MIKKRLVAALPLLCAFSAPAFAAYMADITYDYTANGGGNYTFDFTVNNTSTGASTGALDFFEITFDAPDIAQFSNIAWVDSKTWFSDAFQYSPAFSTVPGSVIADDSLFGSNHGGIAQGASLGLFRVSFDYGGAFDPTGQTWAWLVNFGTSDTDNGGTLVDPDGTPSSGDEYWILGEAAGRIRYVPAGPGPTPTPAPGVLWLLGIGLVGLGAVRRRQR